MKLTHIALIITNDYDVQGDGRGDVKETVIRPTAEILTVCGEFCVPHTLFVEVLEFLKFREAEDKRLLSPTYCGGSLLAEQLREAISAGHDVQLHLHPQWLDAMPLRDDCWEVNSK